MKNRVWIFAFLVTIVGCSGIEWFPDNVKTADTPTAFSFVNKTNVNPGETVTSDPVTITGISSGTSTVKLSGDPTSRLAINSGAFTNLSSSISNNDQLRVQHTASSQPGTTVSTTVTIGGFSTTFSSTTALFSLSPPDFTDRNDVALNALVESNAIAITGVNGASFTITLTNPAPRNDAFSVDGTNWFTSGTVQSGQSIRVRHLAAGTVSTPVTTTLVINGAAGPSFTSTTSANGL